MPAAAGVTVRGILFSAPMVRALLAGRKTQTRRAVRGSERPGRAPYGVAGDRLWVRESFYAWGFWERRHNDRLGRSEWRFSDQTVASGRAYRYAADDPAPGPALALAPGRDAPPGWWRRNALFMPRSASRIVLEIVAVRMERLSACSEDDALAEGVVPRMPGERAIDAYRDVWEAINGPGSWDADPLVWVLSFRRVGDA